MTLIFVGTDFRSAPTSTLETLERRADQVRSTLAASGSPLSGVVVIATCNRFEIYAETTHFHDAANFVYTTIRDAAEIDVDRAAELLTVKHGTDLVHHAFAVTAGLESLVVGETEIVGQVKRALSSAQEARTASSELHALFQTAATVAKRVSTSGELGDAGRSIASVALDHAESVLPADSPRTAVLIGTGAFARVALTHMNRRDIAVRGVYSPSNRADDFARGHSLVALTGPEFRATLSDVDIVVSASGHGDYVIDSSLMQEVLSVRPANQPLVVIDVALAHDVDPAVATFPGVTLIDLDAVAAIVPAENSLAIDDTRAVVSAAVTNFESRRRGRRSDSTVSSLRALVTDRVDEEVSLVRARAGDEIAHEVERALRRVTNSLLHLPSIRANDLSSRGLDADYRRAVHLLFGVDEGNDD